VVPNAEGWAHYTEQMMLDEGYGSANIERRLSQLQDALLRNARYIVAIEMHTGKMSFEQSIDFFVEGDVAQAKQFMNRIFGCGFNSLIFRYLRRIRKWAGPPNSPPTIRWVVPQLLLISTRMVFGLATSFFNSVTVKTPLLYSALTLSTSTLSGSVKARTNEP
jgi:hypothetical protein